MSDHLLAYSAHLDRTPGHADTATGAGEDGRGAVWAPPGLVLPKVGDRVRVSIGECDQDGHLDPTNPEEHGWLSRDTGVVVAVGSAAFRRMFPDGHWYGVVMDDHIDALSRGYFLFPRLDGDDTPDDWYAAVELLPIDDTAAAPADAAAEGD